VKGIEPQDRPREKLARLGCASLGDNELLAIVIGNGTRGANALSIANLLLSGAGGLHGLLRFTYDGLRQVKGLGGGAKAARVLAALEIGRRTLACRPVERPQLLTPRDVARYLMPEYGGRPIEQFGVVLLDARHRVLKTSVLTVGTLDSSPVHPREVFREATAVAAAAIVLFHNHPSGDPNPSPPDLVLTQRMVAAGVLMGIEVLDHVILCDSRYCSLKESGSL
jgi:DNA repair protein RadC